MDTDSPPTPLGVLDARAGVLRLMQVLAAQEVLDYEEELREALVRLCGSLGVRYEALKDRAVASVTCPHCSERSLMVEDGVCAFCFESI
jgi:hypothetical protein